MFSVGWILSVLDSNEVVLLRYFTQVDFGATSYFLLQKVDLFLTIQLSHQLLQSK